MEFAKVSSLRSFPCANSARSEGQIKRREKRQQWYAGTSTGEFADKPCSFNTFKGLLVRTTKSRPVRWNRVLIRVY